MKLSNDMYIREFENFLMVELNYSLNTIDSYILDIKQFLDILGKNIKDIRDDDLNVYLKFLNDNFKINTRSRKLSSLKTFYKFLKEEYDILNIFEKIKNPKKEKKIPKYFSQKELAVLLDSIEPISDIDKRDRAMLELLYASGMRISELLSLKVFDLKLDEKFVSVIGKGNKQRIIPINKSSINAVSDYIKVRINFMDKDTNILFLNKRGTQMSRQGFTKILKNRALLVGITDISAHKLRHSIATHLLNNGADLRMIQQFLGHQSITTTEIYTHVNQNKISSEYEKYFDDDIIRS